MEGPIGAADNAREEVEVLGEVADFGAERVIVYACGGKIEGLWLALLLV